MSDEAPLLQVRDLRTHFGTGDCAVRAVNGVDLSIGRGEVLGIVGESGCGKTVLALSILRLVDAPGRIVSGQVLFDGQDVLAMRSRALTALRGRDIAMIFQQPKASLDPVMRIGHQIAEPLRLRGGRSRTDAWREAVELLGAVGIPNPEEKARAYPHEISGGQAQRVMIATALALRPRLLIADEPTTALDVTVQAQILELLRERCRALGTALILVTHDIGVIAQMADRVAVMYAGRVVENAPVGQILGDPAHPYTRGLMRSAPVMGAVQKRLQEIPGGIPDLTRPLRGCAFAPRCDGRREAGPARCDGQTPPPFMPSPGREARCWLQGSAPAAQPAPPGWS
ncbi:ATP-binding cassette domain-containing protein [Pseudoroseomonas wenyumeiae]|uniref:ABC transporter ATP-binding protein n=1 Tax=Teichococcus wenyumeiae TaxID=2478470 RepID=A0A3A9JCH2_9PROT|nr:ABC transporter ATP-binding protein [Pseudoroseomonas wenyumeiae]RKK02275.1 ABC transporter ATP-binding protein [Pseudoroseomonas wenyumeiae]RMI15305.1 ATP-binding cassette domain-containing protein [Pseudoroseomonas wenyumeiae]